MQISDTDRHAQRNAYHSIGSQWNVVDGKGRGQMLARLLDEVGTFDSSLDVRHKRGDDDYENASVYDDYHQVEKNGK